MDFSWCLLGFIWLLKSRFTNDYNCPEGYGRISKALDVSWNVVKAVINHCSTTVALPRTECPLYLMEGRERNISRRPRTTLTELQKVLESTLYTRRVCDKNLLFVLFFTYLGHGVSWPTYGEENKLYPIPCGDCVMVWWDQGDYNSKRKRKKKSQTSLSYHIHHTHSKAWW